MKKTENGLAIIEFYNEKANSLPLSTILELKNEILGAAKDPQVRTVILQSGGAKAFCGGASFDEMRNLRNKEEAGKFFYAFAELLLEIINCPKPVIARVQGAAVGGGVGIIAAADYVIAVDTATVKLSELAVGLGAFVIEPFITAKIGMGNFMNMSLDCEARSSDWCLQKGLYSKTVNNLIMLDSLVNEKAKIYSKFNQQSFAQLKSECWQNITADKNMLIKRANLSGELALSAKIPI